MHAVERQDKWTIEADNQGIDTSYVGLFCLFVILQVI